MSRDAPTTSHPLYFGPQISELHRLAHPPVHFPLPSLHRRLLEVQPPESCLSAFQRTRPQGRIDFTDRRAVGFSPGGISLDSQPISVGKQWRRAPPPLFDSASLRDSRPRSGCDPADPTSDRAVNPFDSLYFSRAFPLYTNVDAHSVDASWISEGTGAFQWKIPVRCQSEGRSSPACQLRWATLESKTCPSP